MLTHSLSIIVVKSNSFVRFFGGNVILKKSSRICLTFSEDAEAEGGCMVKEWDFEAEKFSFQTLLLCAMAVFPLDMP